MNLRFNLADNERVWITGIVVGQSNADAIADMLRYDDAFVEDVYDDDHSTGRFSATLRAKHWTPARWASFGFHTAVSEFGVFPHSATNPTNRERLLASEMEYA